MKPQFLIGSPTSGSGKTIFMLGLLRALQRRNLKVQPFKCGPDFIDTQYHTIASDAESVNLDSWMASPTHIQSLYNNYGEKADVCIAEGAMGLYDGFDRMKGSCAEVVELLRIPVILVVNARATSYSVAPLLQGFRNFHPNVHIAGVVFNQVASSAHYSALRQACNDAGLECMGYLPVVEGNRMLPRYSGLTLSIKQSVDELAGFMADLIEKHVSVDKMLNRCIRIFPCRYSLPYTSEMDSAPLFAAHTKKMTIAVARDPAFYFLYRSHLDKLKTMGEVVFFSPLHGSDLPDADLIYLPGGYPELFARQLYRRKRFLQQLYHYAMNGGKILAEGGGSILLGRSLTVREGGSVYEMAGVFPLDFSIAEPKLTVGYRSATYQGIEWKGYESHYSMITNPAACPSDVQLFTARGSEVATSVFRTKNVIAGYTHWYWAEKELLDLWK